MSDIVQRAINFPLTLADARRALEASERLDEGDRDFEGTSICLIKEFANPGADVGTKVFALQLRFQALAKLRSHDSFRPWTMPTHEKGAELIHDTVLAAMVSEPLIVSDSGEPIFDPLSFRDALLKLSIADGRA